MALSNNNLEMIKAIANNDIYKAKTAALSSLLEDKSKKNESVINYYKKMLTHNASVMMSNLPSDLQTILVGEVPGSFDSERYYVRESEQSVINEVIRMRLIADEMSKHNINYKNTTLLYGESGTGKTELGRYIAYKLNLPFFYISFVSTIDSYMGSTAKNLHKVFEFCNSIPCVLMLDEIDCIAAKRSNNGSKGADGELERTTITLMQELDKLPNHVTLIAATNRLDIIDEAMMRRFSNHHEVKNMSDIELYNMVHKYLKATDTEKYVTGESINELISTCSNPGQIMPKLNQLIGAGIYEEKKDTLLKDNTDETDNPDLWEVSYIWKMNIPAKTEEDAIAVARNSRNSYRTSGATENYSAKRADFIFTEKK